jgi:hypothetical protein
MHAGAHTNNGASHAPGFFMAEVGIFLLFILYTGVNSDYK